MGSPRPERQDKVVGHSRIEPISGISISEHWTGAKGSNGVAYERLDAESKHPSSVLDQATTRTACCNSKAASNTATLILVGAKKNAQTGKPQRQRITWTPNKTVGVHQRWETWDDDRQRLGDGIRRRLSKAGRLTTAKRVRPFQDSSDAFNNSGTSIALLAFSHPFDRLRDAPFPRFHALALGNPFDVFAPAA